MGVKRHHQNNLCALRESQTEQRKKKGLFIYLRNYRLKSSQSGDRRGNGHPKSESLKDPTRQQARPHQTLELKYKPPKISKSCINWKTEKKRKRKKKQGTFWWGKALSRLICIYILLTNMYDIINIGPYLSALSTNVYVVNSFNKFKNCHNSTQSKIQFCGIRKRII